MRTLRLSLAGTVILTLLAGLAVVVVAQSEDESAPVQPVFVTGTESCTVVRDGIASASSGDVRVTHFRDYISDCVNTMSDPRVSGTYRSNFNQDCYPLPDKPGVDECVIWGTHVLDGPAGGWDCAYSGTGDPFGMNDGLVLGVCPGTGDYEGLTYVLQNVFGGASDFGDGTSIHGLIYEGPPPPWGPLASTAE